MDTQQAQDHPKIDVGPCSFEELPDLITLYVERMANHDQVESVAVYRTEEPYIAVSIEARPGIDPDVVNLAFRIGLTLSALTIDDGMVTMEWLSADAEGRNVGR